MSRGKPEIPATRYNRHLPAEPAKPTRMERALDRVQEKWDNRPDTFELYLYLTVGASAVVAVGSLAVGIADQEMELGIADKMANVEVDPDSNLIMQELQELTHEIGEQAQEYQEQEE